MKDIIQGTLYVGFYRNTMVNIDINLDDISNGYKFIECLECGGTGIWDFVDYIPTEKCVDCKGTGKILVNV